MPWRAVDFTERCQRCDACVAACPERIIVRGDGGFPQVDFRRGACTQCMACVDVCRYGAFDSGSVEAWQFRPVFALGCLNLNGITCRACDDACDMGAIRFRFRVGGCAEPILDVASCNGCGGCIAACPVGAVSPGEGP
jgi:ferredoxin-type protein NapF